MSGAIMEKVWGFLGMEPEQENNEELENEDYIETNEDTEIEDDEDDRRVWGRKEAKW